MPQQGSYPIGSRSLQNSDTATGVVTGATADIPLSNLATWALNTYPGFTQNAFAAVARAISAKGTDTLSVKDFGAVGNNITDDTAAIQAALNAVSIAGGTLYFPPGEYKITGQLNMANANNVVLVGAGGLYNSGVTVGTFLNFTQSGSASCINATHTIGIKIRGMTISNFNNSYTGTLLDMSWTTSSAFNHHVIEDVLFAGSSANNSTGINFGQNNYSSIYDCVFKNLLVGIQGSPSGVSGSSNAMYVYGSTFTFCVTSVLNPNNFWTFTNNDFEPSPTGIPSPIVNDSSNQCTNLALYSNFFGDTTGGGICVNLNASFNLTMIGNIFGGNNVASTTAVQLAGTNGNPTIIGNTFSQMTTGINITGSCTAGVVHGNSFPSTTNPFLGKTSTTGMNFAGNNFLVTENSGTATITNPATSVTVSHGCAFTPLAGQIQLTPSTDTLSGTRWWISAITSTQFTITINASPGSNISFYWQVTTDR